MGIDQPGRRKAKSQRKRRRKAGKEEGGAEPQSGLGRAMVGGGRGSQFTFLIMTSQRGGGWDGNSLGLPNSSCLLSLLTPQGSHIEDKEAASQDVSNP